MMLGSKSAPVQTGSFPTSPPCEPKNLWISGQKERFRCAAVPASLVFEENRRSWLFFKRAAPAAETWSWIGRHHYCVGPAPFDVELPLVFIHQMRKISELFVLKCSPFLSHKMQKASNVTIDVLCPLLDWCCCSSSYSKISAHTNSF